MTQLLDIKVLGEFALSREGIALPLIRSHKTRCLLAYLAITGKMHSREHLCEMFFEHTDDPRGALRWSLSRLRGMLGKEQHLLIFDKDKVQLDMRHVRLDVDFVRQTNAAFAPVVADLMRAAEVLTQTPLSHLRITDAEDFNDWLASEGDKLNGLRTRNLKKLVAAPDLSDQIALKWLRNWVRFEPRSYEASLTLWQRLHDLGRMEDADKVEAKYCATNRETSGLFSNSNGPKAPRLAEQDQTVEYCETPDGVRIAHASVGSGPPIVKAANWLNHLELDWQSPIWGETFQALSTNNTFIRYDERGNGLSDWDVPEISLDAFVDDLETVVDSLGLERFPLLGMSQGCAVSIAYAARHPERVSALVLVGGYAAGWRIDMTPEEIEQREAVLTLTRHGWGTSNPAYRHIFSQTFMPNADAARLAWFDDFQRRTTSPENAVRFQEAFGDIDVRHLLSEVKAPTLVLHAADDQRIPLRHGEALAAGIANARMVSLDSCNHIILGDEPAWQVCMDEIDAFLSEHAGSDLNSEKGVCRTNQLRGFML